MGIFPFATLQMRMNLKSTLLSEISQTEKYNYYMTSYVESKTKTSPKKQKRVTAKGMRARGG